MFIYSDKGVEAKAFIELGFINHIFTSKYFGIDFNEYSLMRNDLRILDAVIEKVVKLNFNADNLVFTKQVHGDKVIIVTHENRENILGTEADAIITKELNLPIVIFTADCVPIFLVDKYKKIVAAVHAGWKGTALKIVTKVVKGMTEYFESIPNDIIAAIGPSIGPCCYEVKEDLGDFFNLNRKDEKFYISLSEENKKQLIESGILEENIYESLICTKCNNDFYSYRRDGTMTGRQLNIIQIKE